MPQLQLITDAVEEHAQASATFNDMLERGIGTSDEQRFAREAQDKARYRIALANLEQSEIELEVAKRNHKRALTAVKDMRAHFAATYLGVDAVSDADSDADSEPGVVVAIEAAKAAEAK